MKAGVGKLELDELQVAKHEFRMAKQVGLDTSLEALDIDVSCDFGWAAGVVVEEMSEEQLSAIVGALSRVRADIAVAMDELVLAVSGALESSLYSIGLEECERDGAKAEGNPVDADGSWGGRQVPQILELKGRSPPLFMALHGEQHEEPVVQVERIGGFFAGMGACEEFA